MLFLATMGKTTLLAALIAAIMPLFLSSQQLNAEQLVRTARSWNIWQAFMLTVAIASLISAFVFDDFSIMYVAENSHTRLPLPFKIAATWGAYNGSLLLWLWCLSIWQVCAQCLPWLTGLEPRVCSNMQRVSAGVSAGLLFFVILAANPFETFCGGNIPLDGADLNPLLQDLSLLWHPPILYTGYVALTIPFAICVAVLGSPQPRLHVHQALLVLRPYLLLAWVALTIGIAWGSFWAYYELGWGGWWFWDPVENLSLLPWLLTTVILHALLLVEKYRSAYVYTLWLILMSFASSLLGMVCVRSGILVSVHTFAADYARGWALLSYFSILVGGSLWMFLSKYKGLWQAEDHLPINSRTISLLLQNLLLLVAVVLILVGTLAPLFMQVWQQQVMHIEAAYFNRIFAALMWPLMLVMSWSLLEKSFIASKGCIRYAFVGLQVGLLVLVWQQPGLFLGLAVLESVAVHLWRKWRLKRQLSWRSIGLALAHAGFAITALGIVTAHTGSLETTQFLNIGQAQQLGRFRFVLEAVAAVRGKNYHGQRATLSIFAGQRCVAKLYPERQMFVVSKAIRSRVALRALWHGDVYAALGEVTQEQRWQLLLAYKPMVRLIWLGALVMAAGGIATCVALGQRWQRGHSS
jgi:cytochrome c-type biogenesis protein CcmF